MPWKVSWAVFVDGQDMTLPMAPYLERITVSDRAGSASDTCSLVLNDANGQIRLPREGARVTVFLQGVLVFEGVVDSVRSTGGRGGGRELKVQAKGFDSRGKAKEPQRFHADDTTLKDFIGQAAKNAGFTIDVDPDLGSIKRDYWSAETESFIHVGQRLARENYGTFKVRGTRAVLKKRNADFGLPMVLGIVGNRFSGNVITWDIAPFTGRRSFTKARVNYFDRPSATYKAEETPFEIGRPLPESTNTIRSTAKDADQARKVGEGRKAEAEREGGDGSVELDLVAYAQAEAIFVLTGARPGVDGAYRITSVTHEADRSKGSTTKLELKQPHGEAGSDNR